MKFQNPIIRGFYPDPSVCEANGKFYLVSSSFQYFPGVPLFESADLINWKQIGHVLTRESQVMVDKVRSSGGVFAPTIRYNNGRFYMITNNNSTNENFYVYTDDIYGEWSEPVIVNQNGIDPSLLFDNGKCYFLSNGNDDEGNTGVIQCEIDIETGKKISPSKGIWNGSGGRYLESPHMYKIDDYYYLMAAEGGTEYGHMVTYARSNNVWGPFEDYPDNPVLTNRNKAPGIIQAIGHGDLIRNNDGNWYIVTLGFRQIDLWQPFHHLGRESFLTPVSFDENGWFTCGDGTTCQEYEIPGDFTQERKELYTFENTVWNKDWIYLRKYNPANYILENDSLTLKGSSITLEDVDSPSFLGIRQLDFQMKLTVDLEINAHIETLVKASLGNCNHIDFIEDASHLTSDKAKAIKSVAMQALEADTSSRHDAGITIYMSENEHYDIMLRASETKGKYEAVLRLCIGEIKHAAAIAPISSNKASLKIVSEPEWYYFYIIDGSKEIFLGKAQSKYLSSEVSSGFTGVIIGLFAEGKVTGEFSNFICKYN